MSDAHREAGSDGGDVGGAGGVARVVVVGAGFGGLAACKQLVTGPVEVTLVDRHNYNTFQPLLYQVATGGLNPGDIAYPVRTYMRNHPRLKFREETVTGIDLEGQRVLIADAEPIEYDFLVIASGAATGYFGVPGAEERTQAIYTMEDAVGVRDHLNSSLERAASRGAEAADLTVVIIGGGPTGVEMAGTLAELRKMQFDTAYADLATAGARVILVEQRERLLAPFDEHLSEYAAEALAHRGVEVRLGASVMAVEDGAVTLVSGETIACGLVIWAAGVGPSALAEALTVPKMHGRIAVAPDLRVHGFANVFAIGDVAAAADVRAAPGRAETGATPRNGPLLPQLAQPALQGGEHAARQIKRLLAGLDTEPFVYKDKGTMATIGRRSAVAELSFGLRLKGTAAWLAWLGLHIVFLLGLRNRVSVLLNWAWRYLAWRRGGKVIVGG